MIQGQVLLVFFNYSKKLRLTFLPWQVHVTLHLYVILMAIAALHWFFPFLPFSSWLILSTYFALFFDIHWVWIIFYFPISLGLFFFFFLELPPAKLTPNSVFNFASWNVWMFYDIEKEGNYRVRLFPPIDVRQTKSVIVQQIMWNLATIWLESFNMEADCS